MKTLESLINLSKIGEDVFFDTCCMDFNKDLKVDIKKYKKLGLLELENLYEILNIFLKFIKSKRVHTVKEVAEEFFAAAVKVDHFRRRLDSNGLIEAPIIESQDTRTRKNLFYRFLDKFEEIHLGVESSIYEIKNKEAYSKIMALVNEAAKNRKYHVEGIGDKALVAVVIYRALAEDKSTSIATRDKKDLVPLFIIAYDKFQYDETLLSKLQSKKIRIYIPDSKRNGEYGIRLENSQIRFRNHRIDKYELFSPLIQAIKESLKSTSIII